MIIHFILIVTTLLTLAGFAGKYGYWFDLTSHFQVQYLIIIILCLIYYIFRKRWKIAISTLLISLIIIIQIAPLYIYPSNYSHKETSHSIKLLLINIRTQNTDYQKAINYIERMNPDILALEEINNTWLKALENTLLNYTYKEEIPRGDNFGIGLYSKIPLEETSIKYFGNSSVPSILANFKFNDSPATLLFTHPVPPGSYDYFHRRNHQLDAIARNRKDFHPNLIVIGDLNTSSWSYYFKKFRKEMRIQDSRKGFGVQTSWPTMMPILLTTIDHCLVSDKFIVLDRKIGEKIGSDHYPVYIELALP
jgi:endonuclease/exonuclease/phosphatase (EEP) superfamily protein YafD